MPGDLTKILQIGKDVNQDTVPFSTPALNPDRKGRPVGQQQKKKSRPSTGGQDEEFTQWLEQSNPEDVMRIMLNHGRLAELFQSATAVGQTRVERYREYDVMADSSLMASFLEMLVDDASQQNSENRKTIWPSAECRYAKHIEEFLSHIHNEELVWGWMYEIAKYGDWMVRPRIGEKGIESIRDDYHPSEVWRIDVNGSLLGWAYQENIFSSNALYSYGVGTEPATIVGPDEFIHFIFNYKPHFDKIRVKLPKEIMEQDPDCDYGWYKTLTDAVQNISSDQQKILTESRGKHRQKTLDADVQDLLEWMEIDPGCTEPRDPNTIHAVITARYGSSAMHNARKDHKILNLVEQSMALARLARSPVARVFYVDTSGANVVEREEMVDYVERKFTVGEAFDAEAQLYKDSYVPLGYLDDIVLPVAGTKGDVRIDQVGGDVDVKSIVDIDYFLNKVFSGIRVPKSFMGYEEMLPGLSASKSLTTLDIRYARSAKKLQRAYMSGMKRLCQIHLEVKLQQPVVLDDIILEMTSISSAEEAERVEVMTDRIQLIREIAELVGEGGGDKERVIRDLVKESSAEFSLITVHEEWFPNGLTEQGETEETALPGEKIGEEVPSVEEPEEPDLTVDLDTEVELPDLGEE